MFRFLMFAFLIGVLLPQQNLLADEGEDDNTHAVRIVRDGAANTSFDENSCNRPQTQGLLEAAFESVKGGYRQAHLACCAAAVERACGENLVEVAGENRRLDSDDAAVDDLKSSVAGNCLGGGRTAWAACGNQSCRSWGQKCNDFKIYEIHNELIRMGSSNR